VFTWIQTLREWFRQAASYVEQVMSGGSVVATPPPGGAYGIDEAERETSTNAQAAGAAGQPWPGNR
jgi:hypothetical protein